MVAGNGEFFHLARNGRGGGKHATPISELSHWQDQPPSAGFGSLSEEENRDMITANRILDPMDRIATVAERLMEIVERQFCKDNEVQSVAPNPSEKEWFTPEETAPLLNRTPNQIRELCRKRAFGTKDSGGKWWIKESEIEAYRLGRIKVHGEVFK
jgi:hypothetical protein